MKKVIVSILGIVFASYTFAAVAPKTVSTPANLFVPLAPCRIVDTRVGGGYPGQYGPPNIAPHTERTFHVATGPIVEGEFGCGIPVGAVAISANFTVDNMDTTQTYLPASKWGHLRVWPTGGPTPFVSTLNWTRLTGAIANAAVVPLSPEGDLSVRVDGFGTYGADLIIDINGYYVRTPDTGSCGGYIQLCANPGQGNLSLPPCNPGEYLVSIPLACPTQ